MGTVKQKFVADNKELMKAYEDAQRQAVKLEEQLRRLTRSANESAAGQSQAMGMAKNAGTQALGNLRALAASYTSWSAAVGLVNKMLAENKQLSQESLGRNLSVAGAQAAVIKNLGNVSNEQARGFFRQIEKIQKQTGFASQTPLLMAASDILSATGANQKMTLEIVQGAAPFFQDKPEDLPKFGGAVADIMRVTGNPNVKENLGLILAIQSQARVTSLDAFKEIAPALAAGQVVTPGVDRKISTAETAALFAGIGGRIADPEGAQTKTAVANLVANLQSLVPDKATTFERLAVVQSDPELQEKVLKKGFKGPIKPVIADLLSGPDSQTAREVSAALGNIEGSEAMVNAKLEQLRGLTQQLAVQTATREAAGGIEQHSLESVRARTAATSQIVDEALRNTRPASAPFAFVGESLSAGSSKFKRALGAEGEPEDFGIARLEERIRLLEREAKGEGFLQSPLTGAALEQNRELVELVREQVNILKELKAGQIGSGAALQKAGVHSE